MQKMQQCWERKISHLKCHQSEIGLLIFLCISSFNFPKVPFPVLIGTVSPYHVEMPIALPIFHDV